MRRASASDWTDWTTLESIVAVTHLGSRVIPSIRRMSVVSIPLETARDLVAGEDSTKVKQSHRGSRALIAFRMVEEYIHYSFKLYVILVSK